VCVLPISYACLCEYALRGHFVRVFCAMFIFYEFCIYYILFEFAVRRCVYVSTRYLGILRASALRSRFAWACSIRAQFVGYVYCVRSLYAAQFARVHILCVYIICGSPCALCGAVCTCAYYVCLLFAVHPVRYAVQFARVYIICGSPYALCGAVCTCVCCVCLLFAVHPMNHLFIL